MRYHIYANQGYRRFVELATHEEKVLIEYEMPNGTSCLKVIPAADYERHLSGEGFAPGTFDLDAWKYKGVTYGQIPLYWVVAMVEEGTQDDMIFYPQQLKWGKYDDYVAKYNAQVAKARQKLAESYT